MFSALIPAILWVHSVQYPWVELNRRWFLRAQPTDEPQFLRIARRRCERISLFCYVLAKLGNREEALRSSLVKDGCRYVSLDWKSVPTH